MKRPNSERHVSANSSPIGAFLSLCVHLTQHAAQKLMTSDATEHAAPSWGRVDTVYNTLVFAYKQKASTGRAVLSRWVTLSYPRSY